MTWWAISAFAFIYLTGGLSALCWVGEDKTIFANWIGSIIVVVLWPFIFWGAVALTISDKIAERLEREVSE